MTSPTATKRQPELRWPVFIAILLALALYTLMPPQVQPLPDWIVPTAGILLLIPLVVLNPTRLTRETNWSRWISISLAIVLTLANQATIVLTVRELVVGHADAPVVLLTALQVWGINVISFSLIYWELDLGGPIARRLEGARDERPMDFRFPQHDGAPGYEYWEPGIVDYAYFSLTNQMAFSPTDVMPMTPRAKLLMAYQSLMGFILIGLVVSRAVNILN